MVGTEEGKGAMVPAWYGVRGTGFEEGSGIGDNPFETLIANATHSGKRHGWQAPFGGRGRLASCTRPQHIPVVADFNLCGSSPHFQAICPHDPFLYLIV